MANASSTTLTTQQPHLPNSGSPSSPNPILMDELRGAGGLWWM